MDAIRDYLLDERRNWVQQTVACADVVAVGWDDDSVIERESVVKPLRAVLDRHGVLEAAPLVLTECVQVAGGELKARPIAAPPYVVVTSRGPMLRATLADGRLVVLVELFDIVRTPTRYCRGATTPEEAVTVVRE